MTQQDKSNCVSWTVFVWALGVVFVAIGWCFTLVAKVDAEQDKSAIEATTLQVQLARIQTDLDWIKLRLGATNKN